MLLKNLDLIRKCQERGVSQYISMTNPALISECKKKGVTGYSKLPKDKIVALLLCGDTLKPKTKSVLKQTEEKNITGIVNAIKNDTDAGRRLKDDFDKTFGKRITDIKLVGGRRRDHYDFDISVEGEGWKHVEHKGSSEYTVIKDGCPWKTGVQFFNGTGDLFSLGKKYAEKFYKLYIGSGAVSERYAINAPIPSYNEWTKDIFGQGKGKNKFILELREKLVTSKPAKEQGLYKERDEFTSIFNDAVSNDDKKELMKDVLRLANSVLDHKDYWLQLHGDVNGKFYAKWSGKFIIEGVEDVAIVDSTDCTYKCRCKNNITIEAKLRWGYNKGISNLRIDLK
ncbi:MAG: hypothetical protein EBU33_01530 [Sphingobacteriia bacterium]|nr:hypothetical protein [Sphingobacteriia bacterium]